MVTVVILYQKYCDGYEPFLPDVKHIPLNDSAELENNIDEETAGFFFEPVQGEGGVRPVSEEFVKKLLELKERFCFLIAVDEIQTGIGRTGTFIACEQFAVKPDITIVAKALGGGLPVGALLAVEELNDVFPAGTHGSTFGGNPVACAAGKIVVKKISDEGFLKNVRHQAEHLRSHLLELQEHYPSVIKEVRGMGLMIGIELHIPGAPFVGKLLVTFQLIIFHITVSPPFLTSAVLSITLLVLSD